MSKTNSTADADTDKLTKNLSINCALVAISHPLTVSRVLIQLGYEPFPIYRSTTNACYHLPNVFSYIHKLSKQNGISNLYTGFDSAIIGICVKTFVHVNFKKYLDNYFPSVGGDLDTLEGNDKEIIAQRSFMRQLIRGSVVRTVSTIVSRPLTVVMIRQIAQLIGHESKYGHTLPSLILIGRQEGYGSLFAGLAPQLISDLFLYWGVFTISHAISQFSINYQNASSNDNKEENVKKIERAHIIAPSLIPWIISTCGGIYPEGAVATLMAVAGSGLAVSMLPYTISYNSWHDFSNHLMSFESNRVPSVFTREYTGAVTLGADQELFARNSHFI